MRMPSLERRARRADMLRAVEPDTEVVGIDEGQFFDAELPAVCNTLADRASA